MAEQLKVTDSQLTKFYICDTGVDLGDAAKIKTALTSAKRIAYLEDLGDFTKTRKTNEYECIDEDATAVSQGAISGIKAILCGGAKQRRKRAYRDV